MSYNVDDQLTAAGTKSYTYDANGNQTTVTGGNSFAYNGQDQTKSITPSGGSAINMTYTGEGQTKRTVRGSDSFQNDETGISVYTSGSTTYFTRTPDGDLISERINGAAYYYLFDGLDSVVGLTNSSGSLVNQYGYDPYGNAITASEAVSNPFRYTGSVWDSSTGLYKMGDRYYDAGVGRFTQLDALGGGYSYVRDNPVNLSDPTGLDDPMDWKFDAGGDAGAVGGAAAWKALWARIVVFVKAFLSKAKLVGKVRCKVMFHGAHHPFWGKKMRHIQLTCFLGGVKGTHKTIRIPIPFPEKGI